MAGGHAKMKKYQKFLLGAVLVFSIVAQMPDLFHATMAWIFALILAIILAASTVFED
jgi:hypothetical protein